MTALATLLWFLNVFLDTAGQLSFKAGAVTSGDGQGLARWTQMAGNGWIWAGIAFYALEFFGYLAFLSMVPLSQAVLLGSVNIMVVMLAGAVFFKEKMTPRAIIAALLITAGVTMVGWG